MGRTRRIVRIAALGLGSAVIVALVLRAGAGAVFQSVARLRPEGLILITILHAPVLATMGLAWWCVGRPAPGAGRRAYIAARFVRDAAAEVLPLSQLGGFALGVRALSLAGVSTARAGLLMFADLVIEFAAKLPYVCVGLAALMLLKPQSRLIWPLIGALAVTLLAIAWRNQLARLAFAAATSLLRRPDHAAVMGDVRAAMTLMFAWDRRLVIGFTLHLVCWFFGAVETWITMRLMGVPLSIAQALVIDSVVAGLRTFAFMVPGAAGIQEGSYVLIAAAFGISPAAAVALSLARRARDVLLGIPGFAVWQVLETRAERRRISR